MTHELKTYPEYFQDVLSRVKTFEVRVNDIRPFKAGDHLRLLEYDPDTRRYSGRSLSAVITYTVAGRITTTTILNTCIMGIQVEGTFYDKSQTNQVQP